MKDTFAILLKRWLVITIGLIILTGSEDIRWFLMYFFIVYLITFEKEIQDIRKLLIIYHTINYSRILAVVRKLKITDDELDIVADDFKKQLGEEAWYDITKGFSEAKR
jgi:hypothetical protein